MENRVDGLWLADGVGHKMCDLLTEFERAVNAWVALATKNYICFFWHLPSLPRLSIIYILGEKKCCFHPERLTVIVWRRIITATIRQTTTIFYILKRCSAHLQLPVCGVMTKLIASHIFSWLSSSPGLSMPWQMREITEIKLTTAPFTYLNKITIHFIAVRGKTFQVWNWSPIFSQRYSERRLVMGPGPTVFVCWCNEYLSRTRAGN